MPTPLTQRVRKRRDALRAAGLRPVQIWVPDTRRPGFADECRRQARIVAAADAADPAWTFSSMPPFSVWSLRGRREARRPGDHRCARRLRDAASGAHRAVRPVRGDRHRHVLLILGTSIDAPLIRATIEPTPGNGLIKPSQVMVDKAMSVKRDRIGATIGRLDGETMLAVTRALAVFFAIA